MYQIYNIKHCIPDKIQKPIYKQKKDKMERKDIIFSSEALQALGKKDITYSKNLR